MPSVQTTRQYSTANKTYQGLQSLGIWCQVIWYTYTSILGEHAAPEDGGSSFLQNIWYFYIQITICNVTNKCKVSIHNNENLKSQITELMKAKLW